MTREALDKTRLIQAIAEDEIVLPDKDLSLELNIELIKHDIRLLNFKIDKLASELR